MEERKDRCNFDFDAEFTPIDSGELEEKEWNAD